jgi:hypothetical protein
LIVDGFWLPSSRFESVPWPPPTKGGGATVLALYLLAFGLDYRADRNQLVRADNLYRRLGIPKRNAAGKFKRALKQVNAHLEKIGAGVRFRHRLTSKGQVQIFKLKHTQPTQQQPKPARDDGPTKDERQPQRSPLNDDGLSADERQEERRREHAYEAYKQRQRERAEMAAMVQTLKGTSLSEIALSVHFGG